MTKKETILKILLEKVEQNILVIESAMDAARDSRDSDLKSSVGDKYETGRAMAQLEIEKLSEQIDQAIAQKNTLMAIDPSSSHRQVDTGSLIETDAGTYFIAIGMGKIDIGDSVIFVISLSSPVGRQLFKKESGDIIEIMNKKIMIKSVC